VLRTAIPDSGLQLYTVIVCSTIGCHSNSWASY